jgi:DNA repair protein RecN (Recombination protein N)
MLKNLTIHNYVLIEYLEMPPSKSMNVITGETGAGKSILLGALGLLKGKRADTKVLLDKANKCVIEGVFDLSGYELKELFEKLDLDYEASCIIRRQIAPSGRSRAFINDNPVTLEVLREVGNYLMDIHSQHDTLQLGSNDFQLDILDNYAQNYTLQASYQAVYKKFKKAEKAYKNLVDKATELQKEYDYNSFLLEEFGKIPLEELDQDSLESELEKLENVEKIKTHLSIAFNTLSNEDGQGVEDALQDILSELSKIVSFGEVYEALHQRLESIFIEVKDLAQELDSEGSDLEMDEEQTELIRTQLSTLYHLEQKHRVQSVEELLVIRDEIAEKVSAVENFEDETRIAQENLEMSKQNVLKVAQSLHTSRQGVCQEIQDKIQSTLFDLGMPNARLKIAFSQISPTTTGTDSIEFLFTANKGIEAQPLKEVASGGEFSRLMLAIKYLMASKVKLPTIIFDEIDSGISGEIAIKVGKMLQQMAKNHQIIAISHLPQVAAKANAHYFVYKSQDGQERTTSQIRQLADNERLTEIAQMIGGANPSPSTFKSAKELLYN